MSGEGKKYKTIEETKKYHKDKKVTELLSASLDTMKETFKAKGDTKEQVLLTMEENFNKYKELYAQSLEEVRPKVVPVGQQIITTARLMNIMEYGGKVFFDNFDAEVMKGLTESIDSKQKVLRKGHFCKEVEEGEWVEIDMKNFFRIKNPNSVHAEEVFELDTEEIDGHKYLVIHERDIKFIYRD